MLISFLFLEENICCGYSLEAPHNICFRQEIRKIFCGYPLLSVAMRVYATWRDKFPTLVFTCDAWRRKNEMGIREYYMGRKTDRNIDSILYFFWSMKCEEKYPKHVLGCPIYKVCHQKHIFFFLHNLLFNGILPESTCNNSLSLPVNIFHSSR